MAKQSNSPETSPETSKPTPEEQASLAYRKRLATYALMQAHEGDEIRMAQSRARVSVHAAIERVRTALSLGVSTRGVPLPAANDNGQPVIDVTASEPAKRIASK